MVNRDSTKNNKNNNNRCNRTLLYILFCLNVKLRAAVRLDNHANNDTYVV